MSLHCCFHAFYNAHKGAKIRFEIHRSYKLYIYIYIYLEVCGLRIVYLVLVRVHLPHVACVWWAFLYFWAGLLPAALQPNSSGIGESGLT